MTTYFNLGALIGFINGLIVILALYMLYRYIRRRTMTLLRSNLEVVERELSAFATKMTGTTDFGLYMDQFLDQMLKGLKNQIPMGSMLFTNAISLKIKDFAKIEMLKKVPQLTKDFASSPALHTFLQKKLAPKILHSLFARFQAFKYIIVIVLLGITTACGALVGLVIYLLSYHG